MMKGALQGGDGFSGDATIIKQKKHENHRHAEVFPQTSRPAAMAVVRLYPHEFRKKAGENRVFVQY